MILAPGVAAIPRAPDRLGEIGRETPECEPPDKIVSADEDWPWPGVGVPRTVGDSPPDCISCVASGSGGTIRVSSSRPPMALWNCAGYHGPGRQPRPPWTVL